MDPIGFSPHDHRRCRTAATRAAEAACAAQGLRFTERRRQVLEILLADHRALGAYDVLDAMRAAGATVQPPAAYRALDFLVTHGFAHKVERLNAFIACAHPGEAHAPVFLICRSCRVVAEAPCAAIRTVLADTAGTAGFGVETAAIEAVGLCPACADAPA
jgi:Fur family zinc uptake transcriptional regulator